MVCLPAIATTAYFVAILLLDLYTHNWARIPGRALTGVFAILLILFICQRTSETVAWILFAAPLGLVVIGYLVSSWVTNKSEDSVPVDPSGPSCPCCQSRSCLCSRPCWRPRPRCRTPIPEPKPKPDNCIQDSLDK